MNTLFKKGWRNNQAFTAITTFFAILVVSLSIFLSLVIAKNQAISQETKRLQNITTDVLARMSTTRAQFSNVVHHFSAVSDADACSPEHIRKMQEFNVNGFFLQAIAHMKGTSIECSSMPGVLDGMDLGQPNKIEPGGTKVWAGVKIPNWQDRNLVIFEQSGWAVMIVPSHAIEALGSPTVSVGIFGIDSHKLYTSRGEISPSWLRTYQGKRPLTFVDSEREMLVYITPNALNLSAVIAAMPLGEIKDDTLAFAQVLIPLGIIVGLALGGLFIYMAKSRYSPKTAILRALANDEFYLEYQPIMDITENTCVGAEALIRWETSDGNLVRPDIFIPAAEAAGVICQITDRVFELVAVDMQELFKKHTDFHIGINISSHDLKSGNLLKLIEKLEKVSGAKSNQIVIEATERGFLNDDASLQLMRDIRRHGVKIAIDDFGTGYSSLSYLTKFELDYLKIDKAFIDAVGTDAVTGHVAFHIIEMAKSLKLEMVAEGVETEDQARILLERGVKYVQGWLFSKSLKPAEFYIYVERHTKFFNN
ncbi:EAL domain-containing protein [Methylobacillus gramineus]|uniref:EAL domain-containing protein n=1 Tax=Methylobacillus gramineus TaxID=755169 RepID=UPI001CFFF3D8|nr:EAL domain-containing protein [Methylobacillus gramineus]MCB5184001.1 EAL domain-containing protein [Methylobacillus gramineus]